MARKPILDLLDGYEEPKGAGGETLPLGKRFFVREISGIMTAEMKRRASSRFYKFFNTLSRLITYTKAKTYGTAALTFGALAFVFELLGYYFGFVSEIPVATLVICGVFSAFGLLLLFFDKPIPIILQDNPVFDFIFFDFFCIQRVHRRTDERGIPTAAAVVIGVAMAMLSLFVSPLYFIAGIFLLLYILTAHGSPEFSYITGLLMIPFLDIIPYADVFFIFTLVLTAISFVRKVVWGKRIIFFEQYDALLILTMLIILISGIFIKGMDSFTSSAVLCVMSLGYFLTSSIITNRRLADRVMNTVVVSAIPPSLWAVTSYAVKSVEAGEFIRPSESAFFSSTAIFAAFLIAALFFSFANIIQIHAWYKKLFYFSMLLLSVSALLVSGEAFAVFAVLLGFISYFIFKFRRSVVLFAAPILSILPLLIYLLPRSALDRLFAFVPSVESLSAYTEALGFALSEILSNPILGIGIGSGSFASEMAEHGITLTDSGNLFIELALEAGIFALICFAFLLICRARHRVEYYNPFVRGSVVKHSQPAVAACVSALIFYGMFSYIWADISMFYLFFAVFAVEGAMLRISRRARDDRILYYEDARSSESSAVDVSLISSDN